jgi:putative modified peptide
MADFKLTTEQADALLDKLTNDPDYRALFQKDVGAAFAQLPGKPAAPANLEEGCCLKPKSLASPEQLKASRAKLAGTFTSLVEFLPHLLENPTP